MASPQSNAHSEAPMVEQIITEFFAKSLHIILGSRYQSVSSRYSGDPSTSSPSSSSSTSSIRPRDKWFNLALGDCPAALENMDLWGVGESNFLPLVIDVILVRRPSDPDQIRRPPGSCLVRNPNSPREETSGEKIIERWVVQYESREGNKSSRASTSSGTSASSSHSEMSTSQRKIYKRSTILLRSLYLTVRLLPAYKIFRDLASTGQIFPFSLAHRVSSFVEPFTRVEDAEMEKFLFSPIETPCGRLCLSVSYLPSLEDLSSEPWTPLPAQFISDYVGSPLADPLKRFESLPSAVSVPTYVSFTRRHSWSNSRRSTPSASASASASASPSSSSQRANPDITLPVQRSISFDDKNRSSPSSFPGRISLNTLMLTDSAPLKYQLPPLPSPKSTRGQDPVLPSLKGSTGGGNLTSRFSMMDEFVNSGFFCPFVEDEDFRADPPESRDHHPIDRQDSGSFAPMRKSQGAAVGELVIMLKSALPLHQDLPKLENSVAPPPQEDLLGRGAARLGRNLSAPVAVGSATSSLSILRSRTTSDALEELRSYREMKDLLLRQDSAARRENLLLEHLDS